MKQITTIILVGVIIYVLTGSHIPDQLNEMAIVQAIGIDKKNDEFEISFQIYAPSGSKGEIDTSKDNATVISSTGKTISEAITNATNLQGKVLFIGHNRLLIISEEIASDGIESIFSYFNTTAKTRDNAQVIMVKGKAKDIISTNVDQGIVPAETIENISENSEQNGYILHCPYYLLTQNMYLYSGASAMPIIEKVESDAESSKNGSGEASEDSASSAQLKEISGLKIENTAIYKNYKYIGELDKNNSRGLSFLSDGVESTVIVTANDNFMISVNLYCSDTQTSITTNDIPTFNVTIKSCALVSEIINPSESEFGEKNIIEIEKIAEQIIASECESAFEKVINEYKADVLYISNLLLKSDKSEWEIYKDDFDSFMGELEIKVDVDVEIDKLGLQIP